MSDTALTGRGCVLGDGLRHWQVESEEVCTFPGNAYGWVPEPPEFGRYWAVVVARTRRQARVEACKLEDFAGWVADARSDARPPFAGLTVSPFTCSEHDTCWGCCEEGCQPCLAADKAKWDAELALAGPLEHEGETT